MSTRIVEFTLRVEQGDRFNLEDLPRPTEIVRRRGGGTTFYEWTLEEPDWGGLRALRLAMPTDTSSWSETWRIRRAQFQDLSAATIVNLTPPQEREMWLTGAPTRARCSTCRRDSWQLPDVQDEPVVLHGPLNDRGVFLPRDSRCLIVHEDVLIALTKAGLCTGIHAISVNWEGSSEFVWIRGTQALGHALRPFGSDRPACNECGQTYARYGFYPTFEIGSKTGWMWSERDGPVDTLVSGDVYRFMDGKWGLKPGELSGMMRGDISEIDQAFLPAEYRRPEHAIPWSEEER
jgi:hypothetical protein